MRSLCAECPLKRAAECSSHHRHCSTRRQHFYLECFRRAPLENRKIAVLKRMRMLRFQVSDRVACVSSPQAVEARRFLFTTPTSRTGRHGTTAEAGLTSVANVDQVGGVLFGPSEFFHQDKVLIITQETGVTLSACSLPAHLFPTAWASVVWVCCRPVLSEHHINHLHMLANTPAGRDHGRHGRTEAGLRDAVRHWMVSLVVWWFWDGWVFLWGIPRRACMPSPETAALTYRSTSTSWSTANSHMNMRRGWMMRMRIVFFILHIIFFYMCVKEAFSWQRWNHSDEDLSLSWFWTLNPLTWVLYSIANFWYFSFCVGEF